MLTLLCTRAVVQTQNMEYDRAVKILSPTIFAIWSIAEAPRLLFGYTGNLKEKVPQMASFVLLTFFPSLPALCYFLFAEVNKLPLEWALHVIQFGFTLAELYFGRRALSLLIRSQRDRCAATGQSTSTAASHAAAMALLKSRCRTTTGVVLANLTPAAVRV